MPAADRVGRSAPNFGLRLMKASVLLIAVIALGSWLSPSAVQLYVAAPLVSALVICTIFSRLMLRRTGTVPLDDLGFWHVGVVSLYVILPLGIFLVLGMQYTPLNDLRLFAADPSPALVARIGWYHVAYLAATAVTYLWTTRHVVPADGRRPRIGPELALAAILVWVACELFFTGLGLFFRLSAETYFDSYVVVQRLPIFARQLYRLVTGIRIVVSLVVLSWLFADIRKRSWLLGVWLAIVGTQTVVAGGSRTALMILLVGSMILYHRFVRPVRLSVAIAAATVGLAGFTVLGIVRQAKLEADYGSGNGALVTGVSSGEFDAVFATALDLDVKRTGHEYDIVSPVNYLSEIFAPVPSQLLPFRKVDLSNWYLATFYPVKYEQGEGFAFGAVAQSIVGLGWPEVMVRGALLGLAFGWLTRWSAARRDRIWAVVIYLWFTVLSYQAFRNSTGALFSMFLQQVVPSMGLLWFITQAVARLRSGHGTTRPRTPPLDTLAPTAAKS